MTGDSGAAGGSGSGGGGSSGGRKKTEAERRFEEMQRERVRCFAPLGIVCGPDS
jgi:hypothetical protein